MSVFLYLYQMYMYSLIYSTFSLMQEPKARLKRNMIRSWLIMWNDE